MDSWEKFQMNQSDYRGRQRNASREIEIDLQPSCWLAATGSAWVVFSFPPFPVSRFSDDPGTELANKGEGPTLSESKPH